MKRFITAMLFSLTVIVCEQQTLFAPHYTDYGGVTDFTSDTTNSLVPVAGVDRSVPVAGTNSGLHSMSSPLFRSSTTAVADPTDCPNIVDPEDCTTLSAIAIFASIEHSGLFTAPTERPNIIAPNYSPDDPIFYFSHHANIDKIW
jgi:hypothetical protein